MVCVCTSLPVLIWNKVLSTRQSCGIVTRGSFRPESTTVRGGFETTDSRPRCGSSSLYLTPGVHFELECPQSPKETSSLAFGSPQRTDDICSFSNNEGFLVYALSKIFDRDVHKKSIFQRTS